MMNIKNAFIILIIYLVSWVIAYYFVNEGLHIKYMIEYFVSAWTFSGGERPAIVWFLSLAIFFILSLLVWLIIKWISQNEQKNI